MSAFEFVKGFLEFLNVVLRFQRRDELPFQVAEIFSFTVYLIYVCLVYQYSVFGYCLEMNVLFLSSQTK